MIKKQSTIFQSKKNINNINDVNNMDKQRNHSTEIKKLNQLAGSSARVLLSIKSVFPFNFFPDKINIDEIKISIQANYFFFSREVRSIEYKDIFNIAIQESILFARLEIFDRYFSQAPFAVEYLWKSDARRARRLIQGLIIAHKQNIKTRLVPKQELLEKLERIGQTQ